MGLQIWPPSEPPLYSMACLDVETPTFCRGTFKSVLQLCLQQRRSREQLVEQGIMPPLKMPAAFHEQIRNLERARTGNFLKHKICNRPERSELVRMHILQETQAEPSLQATQMKLKRARLADDLNEKIALRPGPMELVVKNILPVDTDVKDTKIDDHEPKMHDVYNFDEDSNDSQSAISAEQPSKPAAQQSSSASPRADSISSSPCVKPAALESPEVPQFSTGLPNFGSTKEKQNNHLADTALQPISNVAPNVRGPLLIKQSQPKTGSEKSRSKKTRDPKPRVKKLKYHQYVPPDQKQDPNEVPMDTAYVRLLEQQQQFLQLQILTQQQHHYSCQAIPPTPLSRLGKEGENSCSNVALRGNNLSALHAAFTTPDGPAHSNRTQDMSDHFPSNLDDMKVAELKMELKLRGLLVSGTKNDLIDRLRCYQVKCKSQPVATLELSSTTTAPQSESIKSTPPVSPVAFEVSGLGLDDSGVTDSQTKLPETLIPAHGAISGGSPAQEERHGVGRNWDKDRRLHEKERQIEELRRQLEREQRLVEELKMQLESEKRGHQEETPPSVPIQVKEEGGVSSHRPPYCSSPDPPLEVEQNRSPDQKHQSSPQQLFLTHQQLPQALKQTQSLRPGRPDAQALQSASLTASAVTIKLPENRQHTTITSVAAGILQAHGSSSPKTESSEAQQCNSPSSVTQSSPPGTSPGSSSQMRETQSQADEDTPKHLLNTAPVSRCPASTFTIHPIPKVPVHNPTMMLISKCKDPPRYEDAVKQTRCRQTAMQVPTAVSQHMDDLFDVLIESGEIAPFMRQDSSCLDKLIPVTANVTTLPINTVLSRPPAQIQVAQPPNHTLDSSSTLMASVAINQMEVRVEGTLHKHLLEHSQVDTMEVDFSGNTPLSTVHLQNANLDNMDWLDLTIPLPVPEEAMTHLEMSAAAGVFSSEFLESPDFQLNWE